VCHPIRLLVSRESQFTFFSNASYDGLGGWCPQWGIMWQITKYVLHLLGLPMVMLSELSQVDPPTALHIHVLEFIALTINIWLALAWCKQDDPHHQRTHIENFFTDNTMALSWMCYARHAKAPHTRHLACFLQALLTFSPVLAQLHTSKQHQSG